MKPFLSVITINYNNATGLKKTMQSVLDQTSDNFEYIIIDGNSTMGDKSVIESFINFHKNKEKITFWCSEKDGGIWDAMNKGVSHAKGKYVLMLNSGDYLRTESVIADLENMNLEADIVYANTNYVTSFGEKVIVYPENIDRNYFENGSTLGHQNALILTELSKKVPYHLDYKYAGDIVFFIECILVNKCTTKHIDYLIADFDGETGCSSVDETKDARFEEQTSSCI